MVPPALVCLRASLKSFSWRKTRPVTSLSVALFPITKLTNHSLRLTMVESYEILRRDVRLDERGDKKLKSRVFFFYQ